MEHALCASKTQDGTFSQRYPFLFAHVLRLNDLFLVPHLLLIDLPVQYSHRHLEVVYLQTGYHAMCGVMMSHAIVTTCVAAGS